jgi:hypothetical protein
MEVRLLENGKAVDKVNSYAAMRKVSKQRDRNGIVLNEKKVEEDINQPNEIDLGTDKVEV